VFESSHFGNCFMCPSFTVNQDIPWCAALSETIDDNQPSERCPAILDQSDDIRAKEIEALKAEILRLQALVRGEV
jgi:hypothetical protein